MPLYYDVSNPVTTNGAANTETDHLRFLTVANQMMARIMGLYATLRSTTAGGAMIRLLTFTTASTGGAGITPQKRNNNSRAADTTAFTAPTISVTGRQQRLAVGAAQTGGNGGWVALEVDHALAMTPNGGAGGNCDVTSIAASTSVSLEPTVEFQEN